MTPEERAAAPAYRELSPAESRHRVSDGKVAVYRARAAEELRVLTGYQDAR